MIKAAKHRYTKDEIARRGHALYTRRIRTKVARRKKGSIVAIDIKSGDFEVAEDLLTAALALGQRLPDAEVWCERIGYRAVARMRSWRDA